VQIGDTIRPPQALALTLREVRKGETALHRCVNAPLTQGEFDSLVSLAYNVGAAAVCNSTMVRLHNAGQHAQACAEFDRWVYFQGKDCRDPAHRRRSAHRDPGPAPPGRRRPRPGRGRQRQRSRRLPQHRASMDPQAPGDCP
jgi:lysozyme